MSTALIQEIILKVIDSQSDECRQLDSIAAKASSLNSFYLKLRKNYITRDKLSDSVLRQLTPYVWLGPLLRNVQINELEYAHLPIKFWENLEFLREIEGREKSQIIFIVNNDLAGILSDQLCAFTTFILEAKNVILVVWDADNHHWSTLSTVLCLAADFYFPAHIERIAYLQSLNPNVSQVVPLGSCQWAVDLLLQNAGVIESSSRADGPWGQHQFYPKFEMRNAIVKTVSDAYPDVGFISSGKRLTNSLDSLMQWTSYKTHFCACVGGDMPYRVFDGLLTGGVVIVPAEIKIYFNFFELPDDSVVYYTPSEIFNLKNLMELALYKYSHRPQIQNKLVDNISNFHTTRFANSIIDTVFSHYKAQS
jgi:hypothetical protein